MKFQETFCSQCGQEFGPGDSGYSSCESHSSVYTPTDYARGIDDGVAILLKHINSALDTNFDEAGKAIAYLYKLKVGLERLEAA